MSKEIKKENKKLDILKIFQKEITKTREKSTDDNRFDPNEDDALYPEYFRKELEEAYNNLHKNDPEEKGTQYRKTY